VPVKVNVTVDDGPFAEGGEISIACNVEGFPIPRVAWYKDDNRIEKSNRITISGKCIYLMTSNESCEKG
jgi:hypothetical protein